MTIKKIILYVFLLYIISFGASILVKNYKLNKFNETEKEIGEHSINNTIKVDGEWNMVINSYYSKLGLLYKSDIKIELDETIAVDKNGSSCSIFDINIKSCSIDSNKFIKGAEYFFSLLMQEKLEELGYKNDITSNKSSIGSYLMNLKVTCKPLAYEENYVAVRCEYENKPFVKVKYIGYAIKK